MYQFMIDDLSKNNNTFSGVKNNFWLCHFAKFKLSTEK